MTQIRGANVAASVRQRLLDQARSKRVDFNLLLIRYANESSGDNTFSVTAAQAAMLLANKLFENDHTLPELLQFLLRHFARDPVMSVRIAILGRLPFFYV